jgi:uncharacterized protein
MGKISDSIQSEHITWNRLLPGILDRMSDETFSLKCLLQIGTDTYIVPSPDKRDLICAIPFLLPRDILQEIGLSIHSSAGAVHTIIERIKKEAIHSPGLSPLFGGGKPNQDRYPSFSEPCTIASSPSWIAPHLWRPDDLNRAVPGGIDLLLRGSVPYMPPDQSYAPYLLETINRYADTIRDITFLLPSQLLEHMWRGAMDQQELRDRFETLNLVYFIGDGTGPARSMIHMRCWYRIAGPKHGVHIPFTCLKELEPVEVTLIGTGQIIAGLGIRKKEVFAITGANAEGKPPF